MRANDYKKHQILLKIQQDDQRAKILQRQKLELLEARRQARDDANRQKEQMTRKFELMQAKGSLDVSLSSVICGCLCLAESPD